VKYKKLSTGGSMQIVNQTIPFALHRLGYSQETIEAIVDHISTNGHVVDAPGLKQEHYAIFDTAIGIRAIEPMGHVRMMAAVQPFLSGAISKTVNMPETATREEIADVYFQGWKVGLKALAIYRDNCKVGQPLSDGKAKTETKTEAAPVAASGMSHPTRKRLPKSRPSSTTSFTVGGAEGYMTAGSYPDGGLGEVFLKLGKQGSTLAGVMDAFSIAVSIGLQYGVPLETYVQKFTNVSFEPAGLTDDPDVRMAKSLMDYIFRRLALDYLPYETRSYMGIQTSAERSAALDADSSYGSVAPSIDLEDSVELEVAPEATSQVQSIEITEKREVHSSAELFELLQGTESDAPLCFNCGIKMRPSGSCHVCEGCGSTSGCS
jgi:ribonucleoside-diphosphate reductase alpha chain